MSKSYELIMTEEAEKEMQALAIESNVTIGDLINRSIHLYKWVLEGAKRGNKVVMTTKDGYKIGEVVGLK